MTILKDYQQFNGRHYETGPVHNVLAYQGVTAPHTGQPYSEAFLMGVSGGLNLGYFLFDYEEVPPQAILLTRNTFDPFQTMLERLGVVQHLYQTTTESKAEKNLLEVLESGRPAIIWADAVSLPYNAFNSQVHYWFMQPMVVYGYDGEHAWLADRSSQPLKVGAQELIAARGRIKKDKYRVLSIDPPDPAKLNAAVTNGIWQTIRIFTEKPPKGSAKNFGLSALQHWANMLTNTRNPQSWARFFPPGQAMFSALAGYESTPGIYAGIQAWGDGGAERGRYADFLDEAALLLENPEVKKAAALYRKSHLEWQALARMILPDEIELFGEARRLIDKRDRLFWEQGGAASEALKANLLAKRALFNRMEKEFPLSENEEVAFRDGLSAQVLAIHTLEAQAISALQDTMI